MNRLMLCAGNVLREGWQTLDACGGDFTATIPPLPEEMKQIAWDEIEWIHGVGSMWPWEAEETLMQLRGVIRSGGKLVLEQPNFRKAVERVEWLFGDPHLRKPLHMNKWCYTPESLINMVQLAGFERVEALPAQYHVPARDFRVEAYA